MGFPWKSVCALLLALPHLTTIQAQDRSREIGKCVSLAGAIPNERGEEWLCYTIPFTAAAASDGSEKDEVQVQGGRRGDL